MRRALEVRALGPLLLVVALVLGACGASQDPTVDPAQENAVEAPELGACRVLGPDDVAQPSNATRTVPCTQAHTAQTYAVGSLPGRFKHAEYDDPHLGAWAFHVCSDKFMSFTGADESVAMRTILTWAWFRPSQDAWDKGARWYRCDVIGGGDQTKAYVDLPTRTKGLLFGVPADKWLVCAQGPTVSGSVKVPCDQPNTWRAVTTIRLGEPEDPYPGDKLVEAKTKDFCSKWVGAYLNYPVDYDYGYSWFHKAEWETGNRRSVCWAKTDT